MSQEITWESLFPDQAPQYPDSQLSTELKTHRLTELKTHLLIVASNLLLTTGIAFACAIPYFLLLRVSPYKAFTLPAVPTIAACWIWYHAQQPEQPASNLPIKGIKNEGGLDCWINSAFQLLVNSFDEQIQKARADADTDLQDSFAPFFSQVDAYKNGGEVQSQTLRTWLTEQKIAIGNQDDPILLFTYVLQNIGYRLPDLYQNVDETSPTLMDSLHYIELSVNESFARSCQESSGKCMSIIDLINAYFIEINVTPLDSENPGVEIRSTRYLEEPPEDLSFSIPRIAAGFTGDNSQEDSRVLIPIQVDCPLHLEMPDTQIGKNTNYLCDAFTFHDLQSEKRGHWIAVVKKHDRWYSASDSNVEEISLTDVQRLIKKASLIHYRKAPEDCTSNGEILEHS